MQPLQRSYQISKERIDKMLSSGALDSLYNEVAFSDLELMEERTGKDQAKYDKFLIGKPVYDAILEDLTNAISDELYMSPTEFMPILTKVLASSTTDKKLIEKIAVGLSKMDKKAEIQRDKKGEIIYDKDTKDVELVKYEETIEDYMEREVLPYVPDAKAFWEENLGAKNPVVRTGAEIPFTRCFYKYATPTPSDELEEKFISLDKSINERIAKLFK